MTRRIFPWPWLIVIALGVATTQSLAAPSARDRADAATLTNKGRAALRAKNIEEAITSFRKADELDPTPQRKLELAKALVSADRLVEASRVLRSVIDDPAPAAKWAKDPAKKALAAFEAKIPWLQVNVGGVTGARVRVDGLPFEPNVEGPVDPGDHSVAVEADGYAPTEQPVRLQEGQHRSIDVMLKALPKAEPTAKPDKGGSKIPALIGFGVGAVGIGVGSVFGILAFDETARARSFCNGNRCPPSKEVVDARNSAISNGNVSTVSFVVGGVGVAAGVVLLLTAGMGGDPKPEEKSGVTVKPYVGVGEAGIVGQF